MLAVNAAKDSTDLVAKLRANHHIAQTKAPTRAQTKADQKDYSRYSDFWHGKFRLIFIFYFGELLREWQSKFDMWVSFLFPSSSLFVVCLYIEFSGIVIILAHIQYVTKRCQYDNNATEIILSLDA